MESVATSAVETSTSSAVTAAMLGKSRCGRNSEEERCDSCEKSFPQGGMLHFRSLHPKQRFGAREGEPQLQILPYLDSPSKFRVVQLNKKPVLRNCVDNSGGRIKKGD